MNMYINTKSRAEWVAAINLLIAFGYVWHRSTNALTDVERIEREWYDSYHHISARINRKSISGSSNSYDDGLSIVTDSVKIINNLSGINKPIITIGGVAGFNANVYEGKVEVGCQTITLAKFRELEEAAKKIRA